MQRLHALLTALTLSAVLLVVAAEAVSPPAGNAPRTAIRSRRARRPRTSSEGSCSRRRSRRCGSPRIRRSVQSDRVDPAGSLVRRRRTGTRRAVHRVDGGRVLEGGAASLQRLRERRTTTATSSATRSPDARTTALRIRGSTSARTAPRTRSASRSTRTTTAGRSARPRRATAAARWRQPAEHRRRGCLRSRHCRSTTRSPSLPTLRPAGTAYAVWDRLENIACPPGSGPAAAAYTDERPFRGGSVGEPARARRRPRRSTASMGPATLSRTIDGGRTGRGRRRWSATSANEQTIANEIVVDPRTGTLYDFYMYIDADNCSRSRTSSRTTAARPGGRVKSSATRRRSGWSTRRRVTRFAPGTSSRSPAIDQRTGRLYVVWQDSRANADDPAKTRSSSRRRRHGGLTGSWSTPAVVNDPRTRPRSRRP